MTDLHRRLAERHDCRWAIERFDLPEATDWPEVRSYYTQATGGMWTDDEVSAGSGYESAVWRSDAGDILAIAFIPPVSPDRHPVLTVFSSKA